ncbi:E3 ubiquitin-protein ligase RGLG3 [Hondaea fermentalgiana]|uniref:E3 ubiquitin-protein ligase RGLG3 n=1 Tax=Hondaea fermentalgiana TaxID=2315210 RepID=A0A2R5G497_9STRA|nr:E3 ubiquitin-protein ligase RGLG3 [Hondaea fermentalgiana]|eukprot:GBG25846.1 E3 ubiquitin-protein ligase RGLG3 [Hondaea fermentalgiana]
MPQKKDRNRSSGSLLPVVAGVLAGAAVVAASFFAADMVEEGAAKEKSKKRKEVDEEVDAESDDGESDKSKIMDTVCPICFYNYDDKKHAAMAFNCGHTACRACSEIDTCYACRKPVTQRLRLYLN